MHAQIVKARARFRLDQDIALLNQSAEGVAIAFPIEVQHDGPFAGVVVPPIQAAILAGFIVEVGRSVKVIVYWLLCSIEILIVTSSAAVVWSLMHCDSVACASATENLNWDNWPVVVWGSVPVVAIAAFHRAVTHRLIKARNKPGGA